MFLIKSFFLEKDGRRIKLTLMITSGSICLISFEVGLMEHLAF
jgi:hypothetical protein